MLLLLVMLFCPIIALTAVVLTVVQLKQEMMDNAHETETATNSRMHYRLDIGSAHAVAESRNSLYTKTIAYENSC